MKLYERYANPSGLNRQIRPIITFMYRHKFVQSSRSVGSASIMSLSAMLDTSTLNAYEEPQSPVRAPVSKVASGERRASAPVILPAFDIARAARKSKDETSSAKDAYTPISTWGGVCSLDDDHNYSFAKSSSPPHAHALRAEQKAAEEKAPNKKAPAMLPAFEIARAARRSKDETSSSMPQQWSGISSSIADDHDHGAAQAESPPHRHAYSKPAAPAAKPTAPSMLPKWEIEKQAAKLKVVERRPSLPQQWSGVSSAIADDHNHGTDTDPESPVVARRPPSEKAAPAPKAAQAPSVLPIFEIEKAAKAAQKVKADKAAARLERENAPSDWRGIANEFNQSTANVPSPQHRRPSLSERKAIPLEIN